MLQTIHDNIKGWVAYVVLGAIALVFILWGVNFTFGAPSYVAKIDGREIAPNEVRESYQQALARAERTAQGPLTDAQRNDLKQRVLNDTVSLEALLSRLQRMGYRVSDSQLLTAMAQIPAFQVDGKFDQAHAVAVLKAQGRSVAEVEALMRRQVQVRQLDDALRRSSFATEAETQRILDLMHQQRELAWLVLPASHFLPQVTADDAALRAEYAAHKGDYMTPETVDLRFVELSLADLTAKVGVNDAQLRTFYDEVKAKTPETFQQGEQRRVSHILIASSDAKSDAAAKAKADEIYAKAKAGEDFGKLAKQFSDDKGSAQQGGDLGFAERKVWVKPFADTAFAMQVHEIHAPIKSQFGYHIIRLDDVHPASEKSFDAAKSDLEAQYRRNEAERLFNQAQDTLADAALQSASDLDAVARKAGLPIKEIPAFSRAHGGGEFADAQKVIDAAFSADVLDGRLSPIVALDQGRGVVLRASNHRMPQQRAFDEVKPDLTAALRKSKSEALAAQAAQAALARLSGGESLDAVAKSIGLTAQAPKFAGRIDKDVPEEIREAAFMAPKPNAQPTRRTVSLNNGDAAVYALTAVRRDPTPQADEAPQLRKQYAQQLAGSETATYAQAARGDAKVDLNLRALD